MAADDSTASRAPSAAHPRLLHGPQRPSVEPSLLASGAVRLTPKAQFVPAARGEVPSSAAAVNDDDLVEIEFETGERLWLRADEYVRQSGAAPSRDAATGHTVFEVGARLQLVPQGLATRETRGALSWGIKSLKVFGIDLAGQTAATVAARIEEHVEGDKRQGLGVFVCSLATNVFGLTAPAPAAELDARPWLLFLHGTGSSCWGSFGELWSEKRDQERTALHAAYGPRVLAFEHRSLTESPLQNAITLLHSLKGVVPGNAPLHVVSHSRGGLIGELVCRGAVTVRGDITAVDDAVLPPFADEEFGIFSRESPHGDLSAQRAQLRELHDTLQTSPWRIERFVRVACPTLGTTLASGRLDRWLSVIGTLAGLVRSDPLIDTFKDLGDFLAAVVKERTKPESLPGLEAMMPDSAVIALVNWPEVTVAGDVAVIAGDIEPDQWWARLAVWLSDRFYEGDHDLVVNTPSMYGGALRKGRNMVSFHKAATVNHFSYFLGESSAKRLTLALTAPAGGSNAPLPGFEPLHPPTTPIARSVTRGSAPRPVLFLLPGIMGSELTVGDDDVWVRLLALVRGGLGHLHIGAAGVRAKAPIARYYGRIAEHFARTHDVVPFAYDWRLEPSVEADRLADEVRSQLQRVSPAKQPLRFVAHSMGGLVMRALIAKHSALWQEVCAHPDARLLMLGTPNRGSYSIPELLVGESVTLRKLARLDLTSSREQLLAVVSAFPGLLAMLPESPDRDLASTTAWTELRTRTGGRWPVPPEAALAAARSFSRLSAEAVLDPRHVVYVAGTADVTIAGLRLDPAGPLERLVFLGTARGDGRVTWESGIPQGVSTYYMNVQHGDLASDEPSFPALEDLVTRGATKRLPDRPPVARAAATATFVMPPAEDDRFPDEDDLAAAVLGAGPRKNVRPRSVRQPVAVRVVHGNLAFASHCVVVGHYAGDTIVSAEKHLDRTLQGALSRRLHLGLYPGPIETNAVFMNPLRARSSYARPEGAIVVGLGTVGSLSAPELTRSINRALLEYVLEWRKGRDERTPQSIGISPLLIGTGAGGMSVADSVVAILRGVASANAALDAAKLPERIGAVEFTELYQDRALVAIEELQRFVDRGRPEGHFQVDPDIKHRDGGLLRLSYDEGQDGWWDRLQILGARDRGKPDGSLRFAAVTRRARTEVRLLPTQRTIVDQFVQQAIQFTAQNRAVSRTLFELLLPNDLKDSAGDEDRLVLMLDEESAQYPWELLEDGSRPDVPPFAVEHGLLRQLETSEFRASVRHSLLQHALVVGDPVSRYVELRGAQEEAQAVARQLARRLSVAPPLIRSTAGEVMNALYERPYKVLHLAGHGVYRFTPEDARACDTCGQVLEDAVRDRLMPRTSITGMIIGDDAFLTPGEVEQMRVVPELVFVNCCHLGRIEADTTGATPQERRFPKLAANLAAQFIRIGVRAVVAAGWAVDDAAASTFATTFYERLLNGEPFGDAVQCARQAAYTNHPNSNTWGAYQCYGDPDYRLFLKDGDAPADAGEVRLASPAQAVQRLGDIAARLKTQSTTGLEAERRSIEAIRKAAGQKDRWLQNGAVLTALGRAYAEAGDLDSAVKHYVDALSTEDASVTAHDVEQWANLTSRLAVRRWRAAPGDQTLRASGTDAIVRSIDVLKGLIGPDKGVEGCRWTVERLSILGGAHKRRAWIDPAARADALMEMARAYRRAADLAAERACDRSYPLVQANWADLVMDWVGVAHDAGDLQRDIGAVRAELDAREGDHGQFWYDSMRVDCDLLEAIASGTLDDARTQEIAEAYLQHRDRASAREFASVRDQLEFLRDMAALAPAEAGDAPTPRRRANSRTRKAPAPERGRTSTTAQLEALLHTLDATADQTAGAS